MIIFALGITIEIFGIAEYLNTTNVEFYNSTTWNGYPSYPDLANVTWGWELQIEISMMIAVVSTMIIKKMEAK